MLQGEWKHGEDIEKDYCAGCCIGKPVVQLHGAVCFIAPYDGTWFCDECDSYSEESEEDLARGGVVPRPDRPHNRGEHAGRKED